MNKKSDVIDMKKYKCLYCRKNHLKGSKISMKHQKLVGELIDTLDEVDKKTNGDFFVLLEELRKR